ncbi:MAG: CoA transferase [Chloroflexi bacterium]|nr:CoA transferase [Chloroflexota bacterium]
MRLPLEDIRILDHTRIWAGPQCTRLMADMGAQVIKIESGSRPETNRLGASADRKVGLTRGGYFNTMNRNKLGITLDLSKPKGVEVFKQLVKVSDVVVENFTRRVLPQLGIDYPVLKEIKPDIILVSISGFGLEGPYKDYVSAGWTMDSMAGLASLTGYPGEEPLYSGIPYGDPTSGIFAAIAVLIALEYRSRTGKGQHIDFSGRDGISHLIGEAIMDYTMNQRVQTRMGNRHTSMAPHGAFRCQGEDNWVTIAVSNDDEWRSLCQAMGNPAWAQEARFSNSLSRWQHQDELNPLIEAWTTQHNHVELMHTLQKAGVPAGAMLDHKEFYLDTQLRERGFWEVKEFHDVSPRPYPGMPFKLSNTPGSIRTDPPDLGEHNTFVFKEILGMPQAEMDELDREGVTTVPPLDELLGRTVRGRPRLPQTPVEELAKLGYVGYDPDYLEQLGVKPPADSAEK